MRADCFLSPLRRLFWKYTSYMENLAALQACISQLSSTVRVYTEVPTVVMHEASATLQRAYRCVMSTMYVVQPSAARHAVRS